MNSLVAEEIDPKKAIYSIEELQSIDLSSLPHHIAIIMDGNRRWAKQRFLPCMAGHWKGAETLMKIVRAASALGIKVLTVFAFSTENWQRSPDEVESLMQLFKAFLLRQKETMVREGVKLSSIGDVHRFPKDVQDVLNEVKEATAFGEGIELVLAMNYGARDEIRRAILHIVGDCIDGKLNKNDLTEEVIAGYLDTAQWEDPQLLIRTSGEQRLSNFLLWQLSYTEVYISEVLWPDYSEKDLLEAVLEYQRRERRLGGA